MSWFAKRACIRPHRKHNRCIFSVCLPVYTFWLIQPAAQLRECTLPRVKIVQGTIRGTKVFDDTLRRGARHSGISRRPFSVHFCHQYALQGQRHTFRRCHGRCCAARQTGTPSTSRNINSLCCNLKRARLREMLLGIPVFVCFCMVS